MAKRSLTQFVLAAVLCALIVVMTVVPYTGYINYGGIEITTLHVVVALGGAFLGVGYGTLLGSVWGVTCWLRAFTNPAWILFTNPLISIVPRILVGMASAAIFGWITQKGKKRDIVGASIAGVSASVVNTILVLSAMVLVGGSTFELFKTIWLTLVGVNGLLELGVALVLVPALYRALRKVAKHL